MSIRARFFSHDDNRKIAVARWMIEDTRDDDGDVNLAAALMLAQVTFWLEPDGRSGRIRADHEHDGHIWLVRADDEWEEELGLSDRAARRARTRLAKLGFIECIQRVDGGVKCTHIRRLPIDLPPGDEGVDDDDTIRPETANADGGSGRTPSDVLAGSRARASSSSSSGDVVGEGAPSGASRRRGTRCPDPFIVTADMRSWASEHVPNVDVRFETAQFVDYWRAKPGAGGVKLDWVATWRQWLRNAGRRYGNRPGPRGNGTLAQRQDIEGLFDDKGMLIQ